MTVVLAIGMRTMARRNAIIRKLAAVESLGSATVICTDKTGTLTENRMTVRRIVVNGQVIEVTGESGQLAGEFRLDGKPVKPEDVPSLPLLLKIGALCNDALLSVSDDGEINIAGRSHRRRPRGGGGQGQPGQGEAAGCLAPLGRDTLPEREALHGHPPPA